MSDGLPISVVIPAYNREHLIERAVRSAQAQIPVPPAEIIVVDDCSIDATGEVARSLGVTVVRNEKNLGEGGARTTGVRRATFSHVAFLDSDDEWLPSHLDTARRYLADGVVVVGLAALAVRNGKGYRVVGNTRREPRILRTPRDLLVPDSCLALSGTVVDAKAVLAAGAFRNQPHAADLDLWIRLLEFGHGISLPTIGYRYHLHGEGQASDDISAMKNGLLSVLRTYERTQWWDARWFCKIEASVEWPRARDAALHGRRSEFVTVMGRLGRHPLSAFAGLSGLLVEHLRGGRRARSSRLEECLTL